MNLPNYYRRAANMPSVKPHLAPLLCSKCKELKGYSYRGECSKCVRNLEKNIDWLETHTFEISHQNAVGEYHDDDHEFYKMKWTRLPHEHPRGFFGIELELRFNPKKVYADTDVDLRQGFFSDNPDNEHRRTRLSEVLTQFNKLTDYMFMWEQDSSLNYEGLECISVPCSYEYWVHPSTVKKLRAGFNYLSGFLSPQRTNFAMHVHVSNTLFNRETINSVNSICSDNAITLLQSVVSFYQRELEVLGGRRYTSYCQDCATSLYDHYGADRPQRFLVRKSGCSNGSFVIKLRRPFKGHYLAVSPCGDDDDTSPCTTEVRFFKATSDVDIMLARIELVRALVCAARDGAKEPGQLCGKTLLEMINCKPNKFLDKYINQLHMSKNKRAQKLDMTRKYTGLLRLPKSVIEGNGWIKQIISEMKDPRITTTEGEE